MSQTRAPFRRTTNKSCRSQTIKVGMAITSTRARKNFAKVMDTVVQSSEPIEIVRKDGNVVIISAEDWQSIKETLYLNGIPGMAKSITEGMKEPLSKCSKKLEW